MASYPSRPRTKYGDLQRVAKARHARQPGYPFCEPDPDCDCTACRNWTSAQERNHPRANRPAYGTGE